MTGIPEKQILGTSSCTHKNFGLIMMFFKVLVKSLANIVSVAHFLNALYYASANTACKITEPDATFELKLKKHALSISLVW